MKDNYQLRGATPGTRCQNLSDALAEKEIIRQIHYPLVFLEMSKYLRKFADLSGHFTTCMQPARMFHSSARSIQRCRILFRQTLKPHRHHGVPAKTITFRMKISLNLFTSLESCKILENIESLPLRLGWGVGKP